ncbi:MAG: hypothetical protein GXX91_04445 [Verrucomicrobiaceae bacterium]|nr:hypothetical protein [Verrucomicrobiaceae bacterium]
MTFRKGLFLSSVFTLALCLSSCVGNKNASAEAGDAGAAVGGGDALSTAGFLQTDYKPIVKWLDDERFEVDYKHMTPQLIFDQVPLNDIFYETANLPTSAPPFNFAQKNISRRELLKRIANHWKLKMSFAVDASGKPTAVKVEG